MNYWRRGVVAITATQLHSSRTKPSFCVSSNPAHGVSQICDGDNL